MSIDTINYLLSKYYESLTSTQYLLQNEKDNPSEYTLDEKGYNISPEIRYKVEIDLLNRLISQLEDLKYKLVDFGI